LKYIANFITFFRIIFVFSLFFVESLSPQYLIIYFICGTSDILDGYVARKTDSVSNFGSKLDSIADFIMVIVVGVTLFRVIELPKFSYIWIISIILIRFLSIGIVMVKFKTFGILHSFGNKATGAILLFLPVLLKFIDINMLTLIICIVGSLSALEELVIHIINDKFIPDLSGVLSLFK